MPRRFRLAFSATALALAACQPAAPGDTPENRAQAPAAGAAVAPVIADAWVRLSPVAGRPAAAYFTVRGGDAADRLIGVESAKVGRIELHEGGMKDGMMTMRAIDGVDVPADGEASFAPGGNHAMLFDVAADVGPGGELPLTFRFASGKSVEAMARTQAAGDAAPGGHDGH
ncbi:hypothetical protein SAMN06295912_104138 [Sphingomonas laterariae]|uniref:Copper(I)-binding protein n=1 Tax=Edaphosphingomonas laterariae TaxID=861865 RepID=A0A239DJ80_9SPHN|nr:copper chaperone PCu(A)C [Sphingomonas laterariae]SNS32457.1 hypothetical protein SAMN06295912_104138 [Sphingomonas laterariae]